MKVLGFIIIVLFVALFCLIVAAVKNEVTYINLMVIRQAVRLYNIKAIHEKRYNETIDYDCIKDYNAAFINVFDWGIKNILPPAEFEKIKPYIKDAAKMIAKR